MTLDDLGNLGEFVGAVAVVASLLYLAAQIRQNSRLLRASAIQSAATITAGSLSTIARDSNAARVLARGMADFDSLAGEDAVQCSAVLFLIFNEVQNSFRMHREGLIPEERWQSASAVAAFYLRTPGVRGWWKVGRELMDRDFVAHVERDLVPGQA